MSYPILQKIQNSAIWERTPEGYRFRMRDAGGAVIHEVVTLDELRLVHPHLPEMCKGMLAHRTDDPSRPATTIMASWIRRSLDLQTNVAKKLPTSTGEAYFDKIEGVWETESPDEVLVKIHTFDIKKDELKGGLGYIEYVVSPRTERMLVPASWLDTTYPGWRERLRAAQALELTSEDAAEFVCEAGTAQPASLGDLSFD